MIAGVLFNWKRSRNEIPDNAVTDFDRIASVLGNCECQPLHIDIVRPLSCGCFVRISEYGPIPLDQIPLDGPYEPELILDDGDIGRYLSLTTGSDGSAITGVLDITVYFRDQVRIRDANGRLWQSSDIGETWERIV